jgi:hypothetical protein
MAEVPMWNQSQRARQRANGARERRWIPTLVVVGFAFVAAGHVHADGGMIGPTDFYLFESAQQAFIIFDPDAERETMILRTGFRTAAEDFAWVVPVPGLPELDVAEAELFTQARSYTSPVYRDRNFGCGCPESDFGTTPNTKGDITIYEERTVGIYDTRVVGAESSTELTDWLEAQGFLGEANRFKVATALQFYIDKDWYFVAMRIDSTAFAGNPYAEYWYGSTQAISLSFDTEQAVLPMRISEISTAGSVGVYVFVSAPHRMTFPGASTEYANRIGRGELDYLEQHYPLVAGRVTQNGFLTRLHATLHASDMTEDIEIVRASSDGEFRRIDYAALPWFEGVLLALAGLASHWWMKRRASD